MSFLGHKPGKSETSREPQKYYCGGGYDNCRFPQGTTHLSDLEQVGDYEDNLDMCRPCARTYLNRVKEQGVDKNTQGGGGAGGKRNKSKNRKSIYKGERTTKKRTIKKRKTKKRTIKKRKTKKRKTKKKSK